MQLRNILAVIEKADPEVYEKLSPRRQILKSFASKVAVASLPFAIGSLFKKAYGQTASTVVEVLNFALQLEYLEYTFYHYFNSLSYIPSGDQAAFLTIAGHELEHIDFLTSAITGASGTIKYPPGVTATKPYVPTNYDFTAHGLFDNIYTNYQTFLWVAQIFEDTGVRAYKGQGANLHTLNAPSVLASALQIHSVEARHASHIRTIRYKLGNAVKPWITQSQSDILASSLQNAAIKGAYNAEDNTIQPVPGGTDITTLKGYSGTVSIAAATEAFDEPLNASAVAAEVQPFVNYTLSF
jgi:Ferritin-like domain